MIEKFIPGSETEFSFQVNITGTSKIPSIVRVYLEYDGKIDCYKCEKENDYYSAILNIPKTKSMTLYIELVIGGKHIKPYQQVIEFENTDCPVEIKQVDEPVNVEETEIEPKKQVKLDSNLDIINKIVDSLDKKVEKVEKVVESKKLKFEKPVFVKKDSKPIAVDFLELAEKTKNIKRDVVEDVKTQVKISNTKVKKIPFKLIKEEIIEK